jgi:hypothetical protein
MPIQRWTVLLQQQLAQPMFVDRATRANNALQLAKRGSQKPRLPQHTVGPPIDAGAWLEAPGHQTVEVINRLSAPTQLVVKREDLCDQSRAQPEGGVDTALGGNARSATKNDFALELREQRGSAGEMPMQALIEVSPRDEIWQHDSAGAIR